MGDGTLTVGDGLPIAAARTGTRVRSHATMLRVGGNATCLAAGTSTPGFAHGLLMIGDRVLKESIASDSRHNKPFSI